MKEKYFLRADGEIRDYREAPFGGSYLMSKAELVSDANKQYAEIALLKEENERLQKREDVWTDHAAEILAKVTCPEGNPEQKMTVLEIIENCIKELEAGR